MAQTDCNNLKIIGIYTNNLNVRHVSLLMTNTLETNNEPLNAETGFELMKENDTISSFSNNDFDFVLPSSSQDTVMYNLVLNNGWNSGNVYETANGVKKATSLQLRTKTPDCVILYNVDSLVYNFKNNSKNPCKDFKVTGLHKIANGNIHEYSMLLTNANPDSLSGLGSGYTSYQFYDDKDTAISEESNPGYTLPNPKDTMVVHLQFNQSIAALSDLTLKTRNPECVVRYSKKITAIKEVSNLRESISVYPNPTNGDAQLNVPKEDIISLELFNLQGEKIEITHDKHYLNMAHLPTGVYVLRVIQKDNISAIKIQKY